MSAQAERTPFKPRVVLMICLVGLLAFIALLYFIGAGDTGERGNDGEAHAASPGLNGLAGLARLLELEGHAVEFSRSRSGFETSDLLVLTPPLNMDTDELTEILDSRTDRGPTIVILPKWFAMGFPENMDPEVADQVQDGWVRLLGVSSPDWVADLPAPYRLTINSEAADYVTDETSEGNTDINLELTGAIQGPGRDWTGYGITGQLPDKRYLWADQSDAADAMVTDDAGRALVLEILGEEDTDFYNEAHYVTFVIEPDLLNNFGMADEANATLAREIFLATGYNERMPVVFDLTLNGMGGTANLLTLAFRPPFLAATLCLIMALLIVGWRAFLRFGPPVAERPAIAFGKQTLIANGAGLVIRAKRIGLLANPYVALSARRLQRTLGLTNHNAEALDRAIAMRLPDETPFSERAATLQAAKRPMDILQGARALHELERKLRQ